MIWVIAAISGLAVFASVLIGARYPMAGGVIANVPVKNIAAIVGLGLATGWNLSGLRDFAAGGLTASLAMALAWLVLLVLLGALMNERL